MVRLIHGDVDPLPPPTWLFEPWIGDKYDEHPLLPVRTLVIGDSTYRSPAYDVEFSVHGQRWFIERVIKPYIDGEWADPFSTRWINALLGRWIDKSEAQIYLTNQSCYYSCGVTGRKCSLDEKLFSTTRPD